MSDMREYAMGETDKQTPLPRGARGYPDMLAAPGSKEIDEVMMLELPFADKAQLPTQKLPAQQ